jgi:hypothetical protein
MPDSTKLEQPFQMPQRRESQCTSKRDPSALARLLDEWVHGDESEQQETFDVLRRSLAGRMVLGQPGSRLGGPA